MVTRDDRADGRRAHAGSGGRAARRGRRGGDKRVGSVVDVQHGPLRALEHHAAALGDDLVQQAAGVGDKGADLLGGGGVFVVHLRRVQRIGAEERVNDGVLLGAGGLNVRLQQLRAQQVHDAQAAARHLVLVGRADAAAGGADLLASRRALGGQLDHAMVGQNHLGAIGDIELLIDGHAERAQLGDFLEEGDGVQDDAVADDRPAAGAQNAAGNQLQDELLVADDDRVTGIVPARIARNGAEALAQYVHDLTFALVAPLSAQHYGSLCSHDFRFPNHFLLSEMKRLMRSCMRKHTNL